MKAGLAALMCQRNNVKAELTSVYNIMKKELWPEVKKLHPLVAELPEELKDPACYKDIEDKLARIMFSDHQHKYLITFQKCKRCKDKVLKKRAAIKELGFKSYEQYLMWKKIMDIIVNQRELRLPTPTK